MEPLRKRLVGETRVSVTQLGCGGSQLGSMFATVSDADARRTLEAAYDSGLRYFDTAPFYGRGLGEQRFGEFLRDQPRDSFVLSTKVGRVLFPADGPLSDPGTVGALPFEYRFDYSYDGVMRSYEDSLRRLGMEQVDLLLIHDLDAVMHGGRESLESHFAQLRDGGFRALDELRTAGAISGIGAGVNMAGTTRRFLDTFDIDFFILALPYTLLDQEALDDDLPYCAERGASIVLGAPFSSGILTGSTSTYKYETPNDEVVAKARRIEAACTRHGVSMRAAALQFPFGHESVVSVIPGVLSPAQVADNIEQIQTPIPTELWRELRAQGLLRDDAPT